MELKGKVAIVTGGATGIGHSIALEMAKAGAAVVVASRNIKNLQGVVKEIEAIGNRSLAVQVDVRMKKQVESLVNQTVEEFKRIDILINNAAMITPITPFLEITEEQWNDIMETNLKGPFLCTQAVASHMFKQKHGSIINITSMAALGCIQPGTAAYITSKVGVIGLTKVCAREFGSYNINVNAIAVGRVITNMSQTIGKTPDLLEEYMEYGKKASALGRLGQPEDIANLAIFLASDKASFITGQIIHCDGGRIDRM